MPVLVNMKRDSLFKIIVSDDLIKQFASHLIEKNGYDKKQNIREHMRTLARLLEVLNVTYNRNLSLFEYLDCKYFEDIVKCVQDLSVNETEDGKKPASYGIRVGHAIRNCVLLKQCKAIVARRRRQTQL